MLQLNNYDVYIFDCDGVVLDSNELKIEAMKVALEALFDDHIRISQCIEYFRHNFGKSRFHHISYFVENIFNDVNNEGVQEEILRVYSCKCKEIYQSANVTPGFVEFIKSINGKKYIASGSEQSELRDVFIGKGIDIYFDDIFGSPEKKKNIIKNLLKEEKKYNAVMFGDSESDLLSARSNKIDFVFYSPYSNVKIKMEELCRVHNYPIINSFNDVEI